MRIERPKKQLKSSQNRTKRKCQILSKWPKISQNGKNMSKEVNLHVLLNSTLMKLVRKVDLYLPCCKMRIKMPKTAKKEQKWQNKTPDFVKMAKMAKLRQKSKLTCFIEFHTNET